MTTHRQERHEFVEEHEGRQTGSSLLEIIDRALDKGVMIEGRACIPLLGIEVLTVEFRAFAASSAKYLEYADAMAQTVGVVELDVSELEGAEPDEGEHEQLPPP